MTEQIMKADDAQRLTRAIRRLTATLRKQTSLLVSIQRELEWMNNQGPSYRPAAPADAEAEEINHPF